MQVTSSLKTVEIFERYLKVESDCDGKTVVLHEFLSLDAKVNNTYYTEISHHFCETIAGKLPGLHR